MTIILQEGPISYYLPCWVIQPTFANCNNTRSLNQLLQPFQPWGWQQGSLLRMTPDGKVNFFPLLKWDLPSKLVKDIPILWVMQIGDNPSHRIILNILPISEKCILNDWFCNTEIIPLKTVFQGHQWPMWQPFSILQPPNQYHIKWPEQSLFLYLWTRSRWQCESNRHLGQRLSVVVGGGAFSSLATPLFFTITSLLSCIALLLLLSLCLQTLSALIIHWERECKFEKHGFICF